MESSPALPEPYESPVESDKKDKKEKKKSSSFTLRVPLPADALHGVETKKPETKATGEQGVESPAGILPIFPKRERKPAPISEAIEVAPVKAEHSAEPATESASEHAAESTADSDEPRVHPDLEGLSHDLWQDFDAAPPAPADTVGDRHAAAEKATESDKHESHVEIPHTEAESTAETGETPGPDLWHESRTLHLNEVPAEESPNELDSTAPSNAAMAAEVAATEPDEQSIADLERAYAAPAAELPASHPEAQAKPLPPLTEQQRFQDMMTRAEFNDDFVQRASAPTATPAQPARNTGNAYFAPPVEVAPIEPAQATESAPFTDTRQWYPPQYYQPNRPAAPAMESTAAASAGGMAAASERPHPVASAPTAEQPAPQAYTPQERPAANYASAPPVEQAPQQQITPRQERPAPITNEQRTIVPQQEQYAAAPIAAERPVAAVRPQEALPQVEAAPTPQAAAVAAEAAPQQAEEHKTHTVESAWHRVQVENGTNRIVEGQPEGRALMEERRAESTPVAASDDATADDDQQQDQPIINASMYQQPLPGAVNPMLTSGQIGYSHELASGQIDGQHRLEAPRNPVATALTSPLLWVGVVVLLLAFFAAAFL